jgi:hypothetical protein
VELRRINDLLALLIAARVEFIAKNNVNGIVVALKQPSYFDEIR